MENNLLYQHEIKRLVLYCVEIVTRYRFLLAVFLFYQSVRLSLSLDSPVLHARHTCDPESMISVIYLGENSQFPM